MEKKLNEHEFRIGTNEKNIAEHTTQLKQFTSLIIDIHDLVTAVKSLQEELLCQSKRLNRMERAPIDSWNSAKKTAINSIISVLAGAFAVGAIWVISVGLGG